MARSTVAPSVLAVTYVVLLSGCTLGKSPMSDACRATNRAHFYDKSYEETIAEFRAESDLDAKFRFYLCGMETVHPPTMYLIEVFAEDGAAAVPFLVSKLEQAMDDVSVLEILWVFERMEFLDAYDVAGDPALRRLLRQKVDALETETWKKNGEKTLERMGIS